VGFSLVAALADLRVEQIVVVEIEPALVAWHETHLAAFSGGLLLDARVDVVIADLVTHLSASAEAYDAVCLDVDNGPDWTVTDSNTRLYDAGGTQLLADALRPGGVLSVWSAHASAAYEQRMREMLDDVEVLSVPVSRGEPDVVYVGRSRRPPSR
jgi:spermidine synthase